MEIANVLDLKPGVKLSIEETSQNVHTNTLSLLIFDLQNKDICIRTYRMMFDAIDTNDDGGTSPNEFTEFLFKLLAPWPDITDSKIVSLAQKFMEELDADKDNKISREESLIAVDLICDTAIKEPIEIANS